MLSIQRWMRYGAGIVFAFAAGWSTLVAAPPNVLLIIADDLNTDLGSYGHPIVRTPHIDQLASTGVSFQRAYCQYPLCGPSRASMLTGRRPHHSGITTNRDKLREKLPDVVTLPQLFRESGYFTARVGKIYHYAVPQEIGQNGDDDPLSWDKRINPKGRDVEDASEISSLIPGRHSGTLSWLAAEGEDREQTDGIGAEETIKLLQEHRHEPFFIAVGFYRPHTPFVAPRKYFELYPLDSIPLPVVPADHREVGPEAAFRTSRAEEEAMTDEQRRQAIQAYWASISFVDAQVGRVLAEVRRLGLDDNTLVVFAGDHGYHLGEHGLWQKAALFERAARVPLIIRPPAKLGLPSGSTAAVVELLDLYPTLVETAGIDSPKELDGQSLTPILCEPGADWSGSMALTQMQRNKPSNAPYIVDPSKRPPIRKDFDGFSLRTDRYRYTEWDGGAHGIQLYDMHRDPSELKNVAGDVAYAERQRELQVRLRRATGSALDSP